jgi:hypothetical protein
VRKSTRGAVLKPKITVEAAAVTTAIATEFLTQMMIVQTLRLEPLLIRTAALKPKTEAETAMVTAVTETVALVEATLMVMVLAMRTTCAQIQ